MSEIDNTIKRSSLSRDEFRGDAEDIVGVLLAAYRQGEQHG